MVTRLRWFRDPNCLSDSRAVARESLNYIAVVPVISNSGRTPQSGRGNVLDANPRDMSFSFKKPELGVVTHE